jgi:ABC-type multidrug transport system ATPase subunit
VQVRDLCKAFDSADGSTRTAVDHLSLGMAAGRISGLLGHNGAGKTSTIHMLTGLRAPPFSPELYVQELGVWPACHALLHERVNTPDC